jgi:ABC-type Fe3+ transport system substrate-binding protein
MSQSEAIRVCFYTTPSPEYAGEIVTAFEAQHPGIKASFDHEPAARFFARVVRETAERRCPADVMLLNGQQAGALKSCGVLQPYSSSEAESFPERAKDADGFGTQVFMVPFSLAYHTGKLSAQEVPASYEALLQPRWKNQLLFPDPRSSGSGSAWYAIMKDEMGEPFLRALAAQNLLCRRRAEDCLAAGDGQILVAAMIDRIERLKLAGAPVDWIPMPFMMVAGPHAVLFRDAPHPEAGKQLIDFLLSARGQTIISGYHIPNRPAIMARDPIFSSELARLKGCRLLTLTARHGEAYELNQASCVALFAGDG